MVYFLPSKKKSENIFSLLLIPVIFFPKTSGIIIVNVNKYFILYRDMRNLKNTKNYV